MGQRGVADESTRSARHRPSPLAADHQPPATLAAAQRLGRWLSLTLIHQGTWPLLVVLFDAPVGGPALTPWPWFAGRIAGPALATGLALALMAQQRSFADAAPEPRAGVLGGMARDQARLTLLGLAGAVAIGRLAVGPTEPAARLILFGLADVAAFHAIHFGVVARSFAASAEDRAQAVAVLLFGASWGMRDVALAGAAGGGAPLLTFGVGVVVGIAVALGCRALRRWPGGWWTAAAGHWLVVYLVLGFAG